MTASRPNIILIMTDQQRYDTVGALGYPFMETPEIDRLCNEGTTFSRCYVNAASCVPARASQIHNSATAIALSASNAHCPNGPSCWNQP